MKTIYLLIMVLICYSCSGKKKDTSVQQKTQNPNTEIQDTKTVLKAEELKLYPSKYCILPVDESAEDQSLNQFVSNLKEVVKRKDLTGLIHCLDSGIAVSWGGGEYGIEVFKMNNGLNFEPRKSEFWNTLDKLIAMGGAWDNKEKSRFCFPYLQSNLLYSLLKVDLDCYSTVTCIEPKVIVYEKANVNSKKLRMLSYEVLTASDVYKGFTKIQTIDQRISGYVETKRLFHCYNAHPVLEKINGEWKIVSFAPYD